MALVYGYRHTFDGFIRGFQRSLAEGGESVCCKFRAFKSHGQKTDFYSKLAADAWILALRGWSYVAADGVGIQDNVKSLVQTFDIRYLREGDAEFYALRLAAALGDVQKRHLRFALGQKLAGKNFLFNADNRAVGTKDCFYLRARQTKLNVVCDGYPLGNGYAFGGVCYK